ncbi:MAG TPA: hypothetical protein VES60_17220 [Nakamurella sp.]|jgi:hypothetical protein|nr:hypothetical protein [Nakamurella sp.]
MTHATLLLPPRDLAGWLLEDPETAHSAEQALAERAVAKKPGAKPLAQLGQVGRASLGRQLVDALKSVLDDNVMDLLLEGWAKHRRLVEAAAESAREPGGERLVALAEHRITLAHDPTVDVLLDGVKLMTLVGRVQVDFEVGKVEAVVRAGRLVEARAGHSTVTASVAVEEHEIARRSHEWPVELVLPLGAGVDLTAELLRWTAGVQQP